MTVRVARRAMATRFECSLDGADEVRLCAAGEMLLDEVTRMHQTLSFFDPRSELYNLNRNAFKAPVQVSVELFEALSICRDVHEASSGAFNPVLTSGMQHIVMDPGSRAVQFEAEYVAIDLGGIGKGSALRAVSQLVDDHALLGTVLDSGLIHGGTSSVLALSGPFRIGIDNPHVPGQLLDTVQLTDEALAVSSVMSQAPYGHIVDPASGRPMEIDRIAVVVSTRADLADAWATALVVSPHVRPPMAHVSRWMVFDCVNTRDWKQIAPGHPNELS